MSVLNTIKAYEQLVIKNESLVESYYILKEKYKNGSYDQNNEKLESAEKLLETMSFDYEQLKTEYDVGRNDMEELKLFLSRQFFFDYSKTNTTDGIINNIKNFLSTTKSRYDNEINALQNTIETLKMTTEEKERKVGQTIEMFNKRISTELDKIDTELEMYKDYDDGYNINPLKLEEFVKVYDYDIKGNVYQEYIPFFRFISKIVNDNNDDDDFDNVDFDKQLLYHTYMLVMMKFLQIYSKKYIRNYIDDIYIKCKEASESGEQIIKLPSLVLPQTFQTNSLYYLMNRYNTKCYQPDRVLDFGDFLYNFVKPEFRPDTTKALNLFQPGIGKRYNSILIYSDETMKDLRKLRNNLSTLL